MPQDSTQRWRRLLIVLGGVLALVLLCCGQAVLFVRPKLAALLPPTSSVAPHACAHETPHALRPPLQESLFAAVMSSVAAGAPFLMQRGVPIVDANNALCVVRSSDGAIVGHYALEYAVADLAQADGVLYALQRHYGRGDAQVCAMRASEGTRIWCQTSSSPNILPLVLSGGILYVQGDTAITALRASDGAVLWTHPIQRTELVGIAVVSGSVYIPTALDRVCALRAIDGTTRWCTSPSFFTAAIRLAADTTGVYVLDESGSLDTPTRIVALRSTDGVATWQRSFQRVATVIPSFLAQNGLVYLSTFHSRDDFRNVLSALQTSDGATRWETTTGQSLVATAQGNVAYLADSTSIQAREASTGMLLWKQSIRRTERVMVSGDMLYVSDEGQNLYAVKASTGQLLWERIQCGNFSDIIASEPHTKNGALIWCTWGTDRVKYGRAAPSALAAGA